MRVFSCFVLLFLVFGFFASNVVYARYQTVAPGNTVTLGEFVFDDNFVATTTPCTIGITDPLGVVVVASTTPMTANADGWHFFNYAVATSAALGIWPSVMTCGSVANGDLVKADKSFIVEARGWTVLQSDFGELLAGTTYRTKVSIYNSVSRPTDPFATSTVTIYDATRNIVVQNVAMTKLSTGVYEFTYSVASSAAMGVWETVVSTEVESGKIINTNDYWEVEGSPARVTINSITDNTVPSITANFAIANEGTIGFEYQYVYCVVDTIGNVCGGGDDIAFAKAAEFIEAGVEEQFNKTLTVNNTGTYFWKVAVFWGTEKSVAVLQFNAVTTPAPGPGVGAPPPPTPPPAVCSGADFNKDGIVNSVDFSILLYFWKTQPPFRNPCVDINKDNQVNSIDFSILLYQWGK